MESKVYPDITSTTQVVELCRGGELHTEVMLHWCQHAHADCSDDQPGYDYALFPGDRPTMSGRCGSPRGCFMQWRSPWPEFSSPKLACSPHLGRHGR
jgi:hypothetical protein